MALQKKKITYDLTGQINSMNSIVDGNEPEEAGAAAVQALREGNGVQAASKSAEYGQNVTKQTEKAPKKANEGSVMVGFKIPKEAKDQYKEFFEGYGLNLSEAMKNALEYFASDVEKGKVKITLTRHFERVE